MNFKDELNDSSTAWSVGDVIRAGALLTEVYLITKEDTSLGAKYHMVKIDTCEVFLTSTSLVDLKTKFTTAPVSKTVTKVVPASNLTLVADEP
jgi:hypothetical protein